VTTIGSWAVAGPYFEACSCEAICPCRSIGGREGGRSTYGVCDFALGWTIERGYADGLDLSDLCVVMAGSWDDDEQGSPWRVALYIDERGSSGQREALATIFLGRAGGTTLANFARHIGEVWTVEPARIAIDHTPQRRRIRANGWVEVIQREPVVSEEPVTCGIPGHDRSGEEVVADLLSVQSPQLSVEVRGRCGYAATYDYRSDD
jgi:hypothetical protein